MTTGRLQRAWKMLKIFVCYKIICQLDLVGYIIWKIYTQVKLNFLETYEISKVVRFISKSWNIVHDNNLIKYILFTHYNISIITCMSLSLKRCILDLSIACEYLKSMFFWKQECFFLFVQKEVFSWSSISPLGLQTFCF